MSIDPRNFTIAQKREFRIWANQARYHPNLMELILFCYEHGIPISPALDEETQINEINRVDKRGKKLYEWRRGGMSRQLVVVDNFLENPDELFFYLSSFARSKL